MKQNKNKFQRGMLKIAIFATTALFLSTNCKKDKKDNNLELLLALSLMGRGSAEFQLSTTNTMAGTRTADTNSRQFSMLPHSALLTDLAGDNPENYGDGAADGFNDKFITPEAVSMELCQLLAYKSVAKGGPAVGSETLDNASFIAYKFPSNLPPGVDFGPCSGGAAIIALKGKEKGRVPINPIPAAEIQDYDRIGFVMQSFSYYFNPNDVPENAYRYVDLALNPLAGNHLDTDIVRGDVLTKIWKKDCPASFANSASAFFPQMVLENGESLPMGTACSIGEALIHVGSGAFFIPNINYKAQFTTNPDSFLNPPSAPGVFYDAAQKLKFKVPASVSNLSATTPYILITNINTAKGEKNSEMSPGGMNLSFDISVDKTLFWDSTGADNVFSPQLNAADRPNATSGEDNLTNTARKNMIFHLPTIISSL
ncbi:sigma factor sigX-regulated lipoprotein SrpA, partial [Leptospira interrogans]